MKEKVRRPSLSDTSARRTWIKHVVAGGLAAAALFYLVWAVWQHDAVVEWLRQARPLPFFATMALVPLFGVPFTPFFVLAGALFGTGIGVLGAMIALSMNLVGCHFLARALRPKLEVFLQRRGYKLPDLRATRKGEVHFALAVKLAPGIPGFAKNYLLAVAGVNFPTFFSLSMLTGGAYGIAIIVLGDSLFDHDRSTIMLVVVFLAVAAFGVWWWRRRRRRASEAADQDQ